MSFDSASNWTLRPLGECIDLIIDHRGKTPRKLGSDWVDSGVPTISAKNVSGGKLVAKESIRFVSHDIYKKWMKEDVRKGDCLLVSEGATLGECLYWDEDYPVVLGQRIFCIRTNPEILNPRYLYAYMNSEAFQQEIRSRATGSSVPGLRQTEVLKLMVLAPPLDEQAIIGNTLFSVNEKIKSNTKTNQTLEQMAQAIFKSWFVDFEPVKAKIAALEAGGSEEDALLAAMQAISGNREAELTRLQVEQPEQYAELRATAELFPSGMQDSELGEIPKGWHLSTVGHEFDVTMGQSPPGDTYNEEGDGAPFFQGRRDFGERFPSNRMYCSAPKRMANEGDTLLSVRAPVGDTNMALTNCCIGRGLSALRHKSGCSSYTYYSIIQLGQALSSYDSEGTVFGSINQKNLRAIPVVAPALYALIAFKRAVGSIDDLIRVNSEEATTLSDTRDALLPKLLSGELSVSAAGGRLAKPEEPANV